ncbi:MAG: hypothetical protein IJ515_01535 [Clostridia bacterium]|nr:hypothetical protein [Clostridia bacterium]
MEEVREQTVSENAEEPKKKREHIAISLTKRILFSSVLILTIGFVSYLVLLAVMFLL